MPADPSLMPHLGLIAVPGRRSRTIELAKEIETRGFPGVWAPSRGDPVATAHAILSVTSTVVVGTSIQPIYLRHASDLGKTSAFLHEISGGRFRLGLGVTHVPMMSNIGLDISTGRPFADMRAYVSHLHHCEDSDGPIAPIVLATLRDKMVDLSVEIAQGAVWANGSRSFMAKSVARIPRDRRADGFFVGNMIPTVIDDDKAAASAINRRTMEFYLGLPNYRNYWRAAGYADEMDAVEAKIAEGKAAEIGSVVSGRWVDDVTLAGTGHEVREKVEAYITEGLGTPILVPSAVSGGQFKAFERVFDAFG